jgi:hypothetical protein
MRNFLLLAMFGLSSCFYLGKNYNRPPEQPYVTQKVWGNKPVYASLEKGKEIRYIAGKQHIRQAGNIYAFGRYIFQVDEGRGIHVIDNAVPSQADRIGFISVAGCSQISMKGNYLYTNSMSDLVTVDLSDPVHPQLVNRIERAFPEFEYLYTTAQQPNEPGYYECPRYDSLVVGWVKDSIYYTGCYKN